MLHMCPCVSSDTTFIVCSCNVLPSLLIKNSKCVLLVTIELPSTAHYVTSIDITLHTYVRAFHKGYMQCTLGVHFQRDLSTKGSRQPESCCSKELKCCPNADLQSDYERHTCLQSHPVKHKPSTIPTGPA